jgi:prevent-host-death family protein
VVTVGIREFKAHMGEYLRRARAGETIELTDRGKPVARLLPACPPTAEASVEARIWQLVAEGKAAWSGRKLQHRMPVATLKGGVSASDLIVQDREERDAALLG